MELGPGKRVGNLEIERELGRGAFGIVYLAHDRQIGRPVALKVLRPPVRDPESRDPPPALTEIRALGQINSPHVVTLYGVDGPMDDGSWLFAMEYVDGGTLADTLADGKPWPPERAVAFARDLARGLDAAHRAGVVHGDLKPGNVMLGPAGAPKLTDFGLARVVGDLSLSLSEESGLKGTPLWMAPEVVRGDRPTASSDIWGFGVVLYQLLGGAHPFPAPHLHALFIAIQYREPAPLSEDVPAPLRDLVLRCLDKRSERRPASCAEILRALEHPMAEPGPRPPPATTGPSLVGRDRETARLARIVDEGAAGTGRTVLLTGATGTGKTALANGAREMAEAAGFVAVSVSVSPLRGVLRPLLEGVRTLLDQAGTASDDSAIFESARDVAERLLTQEETVRLESREQTLWAVEQLLAGVASARRLFVHLEDVQRADAEDHRILRHLARTLPKRGVLLLMTSRIEGRAPTPAHELATLPDVEVMPLGPLDREHVYQLLQDRSRAAHVAPEVAQAIYRAAQGNPLFTLELLRHLEETEAVVHDEAGLVPGPHWQGRGIPDRLRDLVARRLGRIGEEDRELLDAAAVDGARFDGDALAAVMSRPLLAILRHLQRIYRQHGLVTPSEDGYRFANSLFQEVLYADLAPELRRAIHLQLARHLEERNEHETVDPERLGLHWERAGEADRARGHLLRATHRASVHQEYLRAIDCARRAGIDPARPAEVVRFLPEHADTLIRLAFCYQATGHSAEAEHLLERVIEAATDDTLRLRAYVRLANIRYRAHGPGAVDMNELKRAAETLPACLELGRAHYLLGLVTKYAFDLDAAERWFVRADEVFRDLNLRAQHAHTLDQLGSVRLRRAQWDEAEKLYSEAVRVARGCGQDLNATISDVNRSNAAFQAGRDAGVEEVLSAAVRKLRVHSAPNHAGHAATLLASIRYARGDRAAAERTENEALRLFSEGGYWVGKANAHLGRAHFVAIRGDLDGSRRDLEAAHRLAVEGGSHVVLAAVACLACHVDLWSHRPDAAETAALDSLRLTGEDPGFSDWTEQIVWLVEGTLYGLPAPILGRIRSLLEPSAATALPTADWLLRLVAGAEAWLDPSGPIEPLRDAACALAEPPRGDRRALLRALAPLFESEVARRSGDRGAAAALLGRVLERAAALEHTWLGNLVRDRLRS